MSGDPKPYFAFRASLRIFGTIPDPNEITQALSLSPTHSHRRGDRRRPTADPWDHDMWSYTVPLPEDRPLEEHLLALWEVLRTHVSYLKHLKRELKVDVFCGYRSNSDQAGFEVSHEALVLFTELEIPFGVSIIIA